MARCREQERGGERGGERREEGGADPSVHCMRLERGSMQAEEEGGGGGHQERSRSGCGGGLDSGVIGPRDPALALVGSARRESKPKKGKEGIQDKAPPVSRCVSGVSPPSLPSPFSCLSAICPLGAKKSLRNCTATLQCGGGTTPVMLSRQPCTAQGCCVLHACTLTVRGGRRACTHDPQRIVRACTMRERGGRE